MMTQRPFQRGFTIIELITVLIIAGVLISIAAPSFRDMLDRRKHQGHANELVTDLSYAKTEAVQRNTSVELRTGGSGTCYTIAALTEPVAGSCNCANTPSCTGGPTELKTVTLTPGITVTNGQVFTFEPVKGTLSPAAAASAVVQSGSRSYTVLVTAVGRVTPFTP